MLDSDELGRIVEQFEQKPSPGWFERFLDWLGEWLGFEETLDPELLAAAVRWMADYGDYVLYGLFGIVILAGFLLLWLFARNLSWRPPSINRSTASDSDRVLKAVNTAHSAPAGPPLIDAWRRLLDKLEQQRLVGGVAALTGYEIWARLDRQQELGCIASAFAACYPRIDRYIYDPARRSFDESSLLDEIEELERMATP